jgi:hypothetical protein
MSRMAFDDPHGTSDRARQHLLDNRCEHAPKRHRTRKRRIRMSAKKKASVAHQNALYKARQKKLNKAARDYWEGRRDSHPCGSNL